jgi:hypothetical protein
MACTGLRLRTGLVYVVLDDLPVPTWRNALAHELYRHEHDEGRVGYAKLTLTARAATYGRHLGNHGIDSAGSQRKEKKDQSGDTSKTLARSICRDDPASGRCTRQGFPVFIRKHLLAHKYRQVLIFRSLPRGSKARVVLALCEFAGQQP